ncbi:SDR family oxidoreductase [Micromonospora arborensis]|uniref:SDR family oxidoreductase n=1 Tax=Micromonospora arborensis TaxID=2116518 RepID=UPI003714778B
MNKGLAVVVGGSSGIGLATAARFAAEGCPVVVTGRNRDRLDQAVAQLRASAPGVSIGGIAVDARDPQLGEQLARHGELQHLVLAASGGSGAGPFSQVGADAVRDGFEAKTLAQWTALQSALPSLTDHASITFITAASARAALPGTAGLAAVNGALEAAVGPLAVELAPRRVNAVSPGVIDTPWWHGRMPAEARDAYFAQTARALPLGRVGQPEEVAHVVVALAMAEFVTGVVLPADGGAHLATGR